MKRILANISREVGGDIATDTKTTSKPLTSESPPFNFNLKNYTKCRKVLTTVCLKSSRSGKLLGQVMT